MSKKKVAVRRIVMLETVSLTNGKPLKHPEYVCHVYRKFQVIDATAALMKRLDDSGTYFRDWDKAVDEIVGKQDVETVDEPASSPALDDNEAATVTGSPNAEVYVMKGQDVEKSESEEGEPE